MDSAGTIIVSGAGTGIGGAVASRLAAGGQHVTAVGRRREPLLSLASEVGQPIGAIAADLATAAGAAAVAAGVRAGGRRCAGVVAAAGGLSPARSESAGRSGGRREWPASFPAARGAPGPSGGGGAAPTHRGGPA